MRNLKVIEAFVFYYRLISTSTSCFQNKLKPVFPTAGTATKLLKPSLITINFL